MSHVYDSDSEPSSGSDDIEPIDVPESGPALRIDKALGEYYRTMGINTYYDRKTGLGKFMQTYIEEHYEEDAIADDFADDADFEDCGFLDLDDAFPLQKHYKTDTEKREYIFKILQKCYKDGPTPVESKEVHHIIAQHTGDFNTEMDYVQIKSWLSTITFSKDTNENDRKLQKYFEILVPHGYESLDVIVGIHDNTKERKKEILTKMGFENHAIRNKMIKEIQRLSESHQIVPKQVDKIPIHDALAEGDEGDDDQDELIFYEEAHCNSNDVKECGYIQRLLDIFAKFEDWNQRQDTDYGDFKWEFLGTLLDKNCDITCLMDDFHHFRDNHDQTDTISYLKKQTLDERTCNVEHIIENHQIAQSEKSLGVVQILKLHILDNFHLQFMHNDDFNDGFETPQGPSGHISPGYVTPGYVSNVTPGYVSPGFGNNILIPDQKQDEFGDDIPILVKKTKGNQTHMGKLQNNKMFMKHHSQCSKFVSEVPQNAPDFNKMQSKKDVLKSSNNLLVQQPQLGLLESLSMDYSGFDSDDEDEDKDDGDTHDNDEQMTSYSFGKTWYYWDYYKNIKPTQYISARYQSFKMEILCNKIYKMPIADWESTETQTKSYMKCKNARGLKASGVLLHYYVGNDTESTNIKDDHVLALLFYCNYDNLQKALSETFRIIQADSDAQVGNSSIWNAVKKRNTEFGHWTRLLREAIELYGKTMRDTPQLILHHGINSEMVFDSINCRFCAPTSMTTSMSVAQFFSDGEGLILTLSIYDLDLRYFDVSWLSNYPTEEERLLLGGNAAIRIQSITLSRLGHNYKHYTLAIGIIQNMFDARHIPIEKQIDNRTINAINNLLFVKYKERRGKHVQMFKPQLKLPKMSKNGSKTVPYSKAAMLRKHLTQHKINTKKDVFEFDIVVKIPEYVRYLFDHFCAKWDQKITIDIAKFDKNNEYRQFKKSLYKTMIEEDNSYVAFDLICSIFENVTCIHVINGFNFTNHTFMELYDTLENKDNTQILKNLTEIKLEISNYTKPQDMKQIKSNIVEMKQDFGKIMWEIGYFKTDMGGEEKYDEYNQNYSNNLNHHQYVLLVKTPSTVQ